ncbi:hypothetical protein, partial [Burkholderia pseudomallei]|uniref:hypothetical protein n=1 Tax=Burkholderia pseudomallei TaxID=28450 RepID=UPI001C7ED1FF
SSVNRLFFMTSFSPLEAILSSFNWSENSRAGQLGQVRSKTGPVPVLGQTSLISISVTDFRNDHSVYREYAGLWAFFSSRNSNP